MAARPFPSFFLLLLLSVSAFAAVPVVHNPSTPRDGEVHFDLEELWRAGDEGGDLLFGMITRVRVDEAGNLYVMDAQLSEVHVFSPDGEHLRTLFGEGEGPGEIRGPRDLVLLDDGRVGAVQETPGKLVFVDRAGTPAGVLTVGGAGESHGGFCQTFTGCSGGDVLLLAGFVQTPGAPGTMRQTNFLSRVDAEGVRTTDFGESVVELDFADFRFNEDVHMASFWWNAGVDGAGNVYVAPDLVDYRIEVFAPDGAPLRTITREYKPRMRSEDEKEEFRAMVKAVFHGAPFEIGVDANDAAPVIAWLHRGLSVLPDGSLRVLTTRGALDTPAGVVAGVDVFDPAGVFVKRVHLHGPWNGAADAVFLLDDDRAVVVTGFADAMYSQFTGGHATVDMEDEEGTVEVVVCRLKSRN